MALSHAREHDREYAGIPLSNGHELHHQRVKKAKRTISLDQLHDDGFDVPSDSSSDPHNAIDAKTLVSKLDQLLDDSYREVIVMRYINDLDPKDIAVITGETPNVISVRLHRALKKLHEVLEKESYGTV